VSSQSPKGLKSNLPDFSSPELVTADRGGQLSTAARGRDAMLERRVRSRKLDGLK